MSVGYGEINKISVPGYTRQIFHVSDLVLNVNREIDQGTVEGNCFLYFINDWQYGHALQDVVGHYEFIKQYVPDLKLIILSQNARNEETGKLITRNSVIDNIIEKYPDCIFLNDRDRLLIKNAYYLFTIFMQQLAEMETNDPIFGTEDIDFEYQVWAARVVRDKFKTNNPVKPTRKLYISRSIADKTYEEPHLDYFKKIRILENSKLLEDYVSSLGYEIVTNEGLNVEEQAALYQSASHIITINGTGAYNTIFCDPDTNVFLLNIHTEFHWFFDTLSKEVGARNVYLLPDINTSQRDKGYPIIVEQLIKCLQTHEELL